METLKFSSRGANVSILQLALSRSGYYKGDIDGVFGEQTRQAVVSFQKANGLKPDGIVGAMTWAKALPYLKGYTVHRIKSGDTFWRIAMMHNTDLNRILTANPTLNPENLKVGTSVIVPFSFNVVPNNVPYTTQPLSYVCEGLVVRYPFLSLGTIGKTVIGNNIPFLKIGEGSTEVFYNASHHANEWITTPVLLQFLEQYAYEFSVGGQISGIYAKELYDKAQLFIVPMVDGDGVDLVNGVVTNQRYLYQAKRISANYPAIAYPNGWKANINGVDLNLQYPANWESAKEIKYSQGFTSPAPRDFVGTAPLDQPESRAVYNFTRQHNFAITLSYHSQGELIYWKYLDYEPENSLKIAKYFGSVSGYAVEETPYASGFAGYKDWFIQEYNRPGYTIEVGVGQSPLPLSQFDEGYGALVSLGSVLAIEKFVAEQDQDENGAVTNKIPATLISGDPENPLSLRPFASSFEGQSNLILSDFNHIQLILDNKAQFNSLTGMGTNISVTPKNSKIFAPSELTVSDGTFEIGSGVQLGEKNNGTECFLDTYDSVLKIDAIDENSGVINATLSAVGAKIQVNPAAQKFIGKVAGEGVSVSKTTDANGNIVYTAEKMPDIPKTGELNFVAFAATIMVLSSGAAFLIIQYIKKSRLAK